MLCKNCNKELSKYQYKFCSNECTGKFKNYTKINEFINNQDTVTKLPSYVILWLKECNNNTCSQCGWDKLHPDDNKPLVEVDHIDGNSANNNLSNLRVLCPNCHSMTSTHRARNKKSNRSFNIKTKVLNDCLVCGTKCYKQFCTTSCANTYRNPDTPSIEKIIETLKLNSGVITRTAIELNYSDNGIRKILKRHNINWKDWESL